MLRCSSGLDRSIFSPYKDPTSWRHAHAIPRICAGGGAQAKKELGRLRKKNSREGLHVVRV